MVDTIKLTLPAPLSECDFSRLHNVSKTIESNTGRTYYRGHLSNLRITGSESHLSITGSLSKFYSGNNIWSMNSTEVGTAIEALEDCLNASLSEAKVSRLDLAATFEMDYPVKAYFPYFGSCGRAEKLKYMNTVYYNLKCRQVVVYDKAKEAGNELPEPLKDKNLLRYECRFLKDIPRQFGGSKIYVADLQSPEFQQQLVNRWKSEFQKIQFLKPYVAPGEVLTPKQFSKHLQQIAIEAVGFDRLHSELDSMKHTGMHPRYVSRCKRKLKELATPASGTNELITELQRKISSF